MKKISKTIVFFGNERLVSGLKTTDTPVLRSLIDAGYNVAAVVVHHRESQSRNNRPLEVAKLAEEHSIPVLYPVKMKEVKDQLTAYNADAGVLVAFGKIIPQSIIDIFPHGIINIHPSLLPKYRGPTPIEAAILNGDTETGVSIMQLTAGMDEGPIFAQARTQLTDTETKFSLYEALALRSAHLLIDILPQILSDKLHPTPQNNSQASYCPLFTKESSWLQPEKTTAKEAERHVRACLVFPKTKLVVNGHTIIITKAHIATARATALDVHCKDGKFLIIDTLIAPSGRPMDAHSFVNGYLSD